MVSADVNIYIVIIYIDTEDMKLRKLRNYLLNTFFKSYFSGEFLHINFSLYKRQLVDNRKEVNMRTFNFIYLSFVT